MVPTAHCSVRVVIATIHHAAPLKKGFFYNSYCGTYFIRLGPFTTEPIDKCSPFEAKIIFRVILCTRFKTSENRSTLPFLG